MLIRYVGAPLLGLLILATGLVSRSYSLYVALLTLGILVLLWHLTTRAYDCQQSTALHSINAVLADEQRSRRQRQDHRRGGRAA